MVGRTGRSVTLSWVAPSSDGGGGLYGYRVEMKAATTGEWQLCQELVPGPECVVDGLAPGETYRFRVAAVGPAGAGEPVHLPQTVRLGECLHPGDGSWGSLRQGPWMCLLTGRVLFWLLFPAEPSVPSPESRQVAVGEDLCLECEVAETGEVTWMKGTERVQPSGRIQVLCQGRRQMLVIRGVTAEDQGEYRCSPAQGPAPAAFQGMCPVFTGGGWY